MKTVKYDVKGGERASRMELIIRIIWSIPSLIVLMILSILGKIAWCLQVIYILIFGKRHKALDNLIRMMMDYFVNWYTYVILLTDERNPLMPEEK